MTEETKPEPTFAEEVAAAATEANLPDVPEPEVMTPEEEAIPAPTPGEEAKAPEEPKKEEPQTVPLAVHIRQREKQEREARELRNQLVAMQESFRRGEERLTQLTQMLTPTQQAPDPNTDVLGHMVYQQQEAKKQLDALNARLTQQDTEARSRQELERFTNYVISDEKQFEQQAPDYKEAVNFAKGVKLKEYLALGLDQQQAAARVQQDALAIATHAVSQGASPSEFVYRLAQALGYQPKAIPTPTDTPTPTPQDNVIAMRQAGAERGKPAGGAAAPGQITFADLAHMDNEEFAKMTAGNNWKKLAGGG